MTLKLLALESGAVGPPELVAERVAEATVAAAESDAPLFATPGGPRDLFDPGVDFKVGEGGARGFGDGLLVEFDPARVVVHMGADDTKKRNFVRA
ncbi:MAG TPA: hypothetical protein VFX96_14330 [Pyrinomonadaceae bacterium]|nr:hypothetical protein [Pyrinomonadaceae bacterium]